jgi:hypothetical protein
MVGMAAVPLRGPTSSIQPDEETAATVLLETAVGFCIDEIGRSPTIQHLKTLIDETAADRVQGYTFQLRVYVYPFANKRRAGKAVYVGEPHRHMLDCLRDEFGTAEYYVMFRRGKSMALAGLIGIAAPLGWKPPSAR